MMRPPVDVVAIGQCCVDYLAALDRYPEPDTKTECRELRIECGGPAATAAVALSRWGLACSFHGVVGDDRFGEAIRESLEREGIDASGLRVRPGHGSQVAFIWCQPFTGHRTIVYRPPTGPGLQAGEIDLDRVRTARALHLDGRGIDAALAAARAARQAGVPVVVDAGSLRDGMRELAGHSDHFIASHPFARDVLDGADDPAEACRRMADWGAGITAVTLGAEGYVALVNGRLVRRPAYPVHAVDTTGCGDIFHAAVTYGAVRGWPVQRSLEVGAWAAAQTATALGGRSGIPDLAAWTSR